MFLFLFPHIPNIIKGLKLNAMQFLYYQEIKDNDDLSLLYSLIVSKQI